MLVNVVMLAFQPNVQIYPLDVTLSGEEQQQFCKYLLNPESDPAIAHTILDRVFSAGNRDNRPHGKLFCSVSAGDVVLLGSERWLCARTGWKKITVEQMHNYCEMDRRDRQFCDLLNPRNSEL